MPLLLIAWRRQAGARASVVIVWLGSDGISRFLQNGQNTEVWDTWSVISITTIAVRKWPGDRLTPNHYLGPGFDWVLSREKCKNCLLGSAIFSGFQILVVGFEKKIICTVLFTKVYLANPLEQMMGLSQWLIKTYHRGMSWNVKTMTFGLKFTDCHENCFGSTSTLQINI